MTTLTDDQLAELERLLAAATQGPWESFRWGDGSQDNSIMCNIAATHYEAVLCQNVDEDDARAVAALHNAAPALLAAARRERKLREALHKIDYALRIPAAEYVPAIGDVFTIIDEALKDTKEG